MRIRTRHYSYKTECSYAEWVRRFLAYISERQQAPHPRVDEDRVRDCLTYLAVRRQVSASTQNQALCALLFVCREVLRLDVDLSATVRAKRGTASPHGPQRARDGGPAGRRAWHDVADGGAHLLGRPARDRMLPAACQGRGLRSGTARRA